MTPLYSRQQTRKTKSAARSAHSKKRVVSQQPITLPAFAKINLNLRVLSKRADGYHDLDTIFQTVSLHDTITIAVNDVSGINLTCDDRELPADESNLVVRAAQALQNRFAVNKGARLRLAKRIPTQAGLGGGSSNAAVTLMALARLWELTSTREELLAIAAGLGADVPFFLFGGTARGSGPGSDLESLPDTSEKFFLVIKPNANINTASAYQALDERSLTTRNSKSILSSSQHTELFDNANLLTLENDFAAVAFELEPEIARARGALIKAGAANTLLAGSGSALFGVFDSEDAQRRAIQAIELETGWRVFPCKTVGRDQYAEAFSDLREFLA